MTETELEKAILELPLQQVVGSGEYIVNILWALLERTRPQLKVSFCRCTQVIHGVSHSCLRYCAICDGNRRQHPDRRQP